MPGDGHRTRTNKLFGSLLFSQGVFNTDKHLKNIAKGVDTKAMRDHQGVQYSLLHLAASKGEARVVAALLDAGAPVDLPTSTGDTALHVACTKRRAAIARCLVEYGADIGKPNAVGVTPIQLAEERKMDVVLLRSLSLQRIQDQAASTTLAPEGTAPHRDDTANAAAVAQRTAVLYRALQDTPREAPLPCNAAKLVADGVDVHCAPDAPDAAAGTTLLHLACRRGESELARALLRDGAPINALDANGDSPLALAARFECVECERLLIEFGADLRLVGGGECTSSD